MSFESYLELFARRVGKSLDETCRSITIKWFSSTIMSSPVDTGRLRGNWQASQEAPASGTTADVDKQATRQGDGKDTIGPWVAGGGAYQKAPNVSLP